MFSCKAGACDVKKKQQSLKTKGKKKKKIAKVNGSLALSPAGRNRPADLTWQKMSLKELKGFLSISVTTGHKTVYFIA